MTLEVLDYLKKYIQGKYPMYYDVEEQMRFLNFVGSIAEDKKFKSELEARCSDKNIKEVLESGDMDIIIDDLVNTYAQVKYTKIWANLDALSSRIKNVIIKESQKDFKVEIVGEHILNKICQDIALGIIKNSQDEDYTIYFSGAFNEKFIEDYGYFLREYKKEISKRVEYLVEIKMKNSSFRVTDDTYSLIVSDLTDTIFRDFDYNDIINGVCDREILSLFNSYRKELIEKIENYVSKFIYDNVESYKLFGGIVSEITDDILSMTIIKGEISAIKLFNGNLDQLILSGVENRGRNLPNKEDSIRHIFSFLFGEMTITLSTDELLELSEKIYFNLRSNSFFDNDIISGNCDDKIKFLYENEMRIDNSIEKDGVPKKIKANKKRRKVHTKIISLVLAGTLTVSAGKLVFDGVKFVVDKGKDFVEDLSSRKQLKRVDEFDGYKYNFIFTKYNDYFEKMSFNAADFYKKASSIDSKYGYLGFYRMYKNVMADKLAIMDSTLPFLKSQLLNNSEYRDFYNSISRYECYLDFVKDALLSMGCEQIKDSKYQEAINVYKAAREKVWDEDYTPMDHLIVNSPECISVIEEIMNMYTEYSEDLQVEFGQQLIDNKIDYKDSGRKH